MGLHPLDGARLKVRRASKHLKELNAGIRKFVQTHPYAFALEDDPKTGPASVYRVRAIGVDEQPPERLGVIVGDIAHNLRSALDYLVCALASDSNPTCRGTQFPLCDSSQAWDIDVSKGRLDGVGTRHRAMIRSVQPYHRKKGGYLLATLRELSNADKHRVISPANQAMTWIPPIVDPPTAPIRLTIEYQDRVRMEDGAVYLRITDFHVPPGTKVDVDLPSSYNMVFGEWGKYEISAYSLGELRDYVRRIVNRFAKEF